MRLQVVHILRVFLVESLRQNARQVKLSMEEKFSMLMTR